MSRANSSALRGRERVSLVEATFIGSQVQIQSHTARRQTDRPPFVRFLLCSFRSVKSRQRNVNRLNILPSGEPYIVKVLQKKIH